MPFYDHLCSSCNKEFEEFYSMTTDPPKDCPLCGEKDCVKRVISGLPAVKVVLTGNELKAKINEDSKKLAQDLKKDENLRANFVGESSYNNIQKSTKDIVDSLKS